MITSMIGLRARTNDLVTLRASWETGDAYLLVGDDAEITLERPHVEALHDQIPGVLAELDRVDADNRTCDKAVMAEQRAAGAVTAALDAANVAELAGDVDRAAELRAAAEQARATAAAVDAAVRAVDKTAQLADQAAERALDLVAGRILPDARDGG